jgi:uncharacterized RDD family membrane protein YckC
VAQEDDMTGPGPNPFEPGQPSGLPRYTGSDSSYGTPPSYGGGYGTPAYGSGSGGGVVGPGGEWVGPPLASWGIRVGGYLIDAVISGIVVTVLSFVDTGLGQLGNLIVLLVFGYLTGTTGQTPGRRLLGTKVVRIRDGQVLGVGAGIGREVLHILDALSLFIGFLWPIWDKKNQTFADKIIGSVVLKL